MASRSLGTLTIDLITKTGGFEEGMDRAARVADKKAREIESNAQAAAKAWSIAGAAIGASFAGLATLSFGKFIQETINAQNEQAQLNAVLKSTGQAAGFTVTQLNDMAGAMEKATSFSAGDINTAQTTLLAFTGIVGDQFPRALQAAADMAARTGMTVKSAAETIGRALDVPSQGLASLSRQGFRFTEEQKQMAVALEEAGRTAEAQGMILKALEDSYGGAAVAARDTLGGALTALGNTINAFSTGSDSAVRPLVDAINTINDVLGSGEAVAAVQGITNAVQILAVGFAVKLIPAVAGTAIAFAAGAVEAARYQLALATMAGVSRTTAVGLGALSASVGILRVALSVLTGPIGVVVALAGSAAAAVYSYRDSAQAAAAASADLKTQTDWLNANLEGLTRNQAAAALMDLQKQYGNAQLEALNASTAVDILTKRLAQFPTSAEAQKWTEELTRQRAVVDTATLSMQRLGEQMRVVQQIMATPEGINLQSADFKKFKTSIERQIALIGKTGQAAQLRYDLEHGALGKLSEDEQKLALAKINTLDKLEKQQAAAKKGAKADDATKKAGESLVKHWQDQVATLGMTTEAAERYKIETAKGSEEDKKRALALFDQVAAFKATEKATTEAAESLRYIAAVNEELNVLQQQQNLDVSSVGMGDSLRQQLEKELSIRQEYAGKRRQLEEAQQIESTKLSKAQYDARLEALQNAENQHVAIIQESAAKKAEAEGNWVNGMNRALQNYADNASDVAAQFDTLFTNAFKSVEDTLVSFVMTGKLDLEGLIKGIGEELIRMLVKMGLQMVANALLGQAMATATTAMAVGTGAALASAYAPAAALASLASFGANAEPAIAGISLTVGAAQSAAFAGMFDKGGNIPAGQWGIAGEFGPEIVQGPAKVTSRVATADLLSGGGGGDVTVNLIEDSSRGGQVEKKSGANSEEIINIFVADIRGGGKSAQALEATYPLRRVGR